MTNSGEEFLHSSIEELTLTFIENLTQQIDYKDSEKDLSFDANICVIWILITRPLCNKVKLFDPSKCLVNVLECNAIENIN